MTQIVQKPNKSLVVMLIGVVGGWLTAPGSGHDLFTVIFIIGGAIWSLQEVFNGANWVRRLMGLAVIVFVVRALLSLINR